MGILAVTHLACSLMSNIYRWLPNAGQSSLSIQRLFGLSHDWETGWQIGPNPTQAGSHGSTDEWQLQHLEAPVSVYVIGPSDGVSWPMSSFGRLLDEDLRSVMAHLQSLQ